MRIGEELAGWLGDETGIERALAARAAFARGWADRLPDPDGEAGVDALVRDDKWVRHVLDWAMSQLGGEPFLDPPMRALIGEDQHGLLLLDTPAGSLFAAVRFHDPHAAPGRVITFGGARTIIRFVRGGGAILRHWQRKDGLCVAGPTRQVEDGLIVDFDGAYEAWTIERAERDMVTLRAVRKAGRLPLIRDHDRETGHPIKAAAADVGQSRAQMMLSLLRLMERRDAGALFAQFAQGDDIYLAWQAMREWIALDPRAALHTLRRSVRHGAGEVAQRTLAMVEARLASAGEGAPCRA